jgi:biopolymer transport protein ExbB/TolQ
MRSKNKGTGAHTQAGAEVLPGEEDVPLSLGTTVSVAFAALLALGASFVFYLILGVVPGLAGSYVSDLFYERTAVQYVTTFFFFWGIAILGLKVKKIRNEYDAFSVDLLPKEEDQLIRPDDALQHIRRLKRLSAAERGRMLTSRVWRALMRFKLLGSAEKVDDILKYQGEVDAAEVDSSYNHLRFLIAIVPILGFLGTVIGISLAVSGFSGVINVSEDMEQVKTALGGVTVGLATAFDTTLVALIMSAILMFGLTIFQRWEDLLLSRIEDYCLEYLLGHLWVPPMHEQLEKAMMRSNNDLAGKIVDALRKRVGKTSEDP